LNIEQVQALQPFQTGLEIVYTGSNGDPLCEYISPDIIAYRGGQDGEPEHDREITDISKSEFFIEVKVDANNDPFRRFCNSNLSSFETTSIEAKKVRGQLAKYAAGHLGLQFRSFVFSILICNQFGRFIRWDRAGAIVTEAIDILAAPHTLTQFIVRYSQLTDEQRGHDTSVSIPSAEEITLARGPLQVDDADARFITLMVPQAGQSDAFYIATAPRFDSRSPMGRGSRAFPAYDLKKKRVVYLKDYWRVNVQGMEKEGDIYKELHAHKVPHIPRFDRGGDLGPSTLTQRWRESDWACKTAEIVEYMHYRMVLQDVGRDLTSFNSSWEFVNAVADAIEGQHH
jgi:hypothetical protein